MPQSEVGRLATNYAFVGDARTPLDPAATSVFLQKPSFPYGEEIAGLVMSARDYDRFLHDPRRRHARRRARDEAETIALATSNLLPAGVVFGRSVATPGVRRGATWASGARAVPSCSRIRQRTEQGTYAWGGAAGTIAWVDPSRGHSRGNVMVELLPGGPDTAPPAGGRSAAPGCGEVAPMSVMEAPGFTGGTLDRSDALRHDPERPGGGTGRDRRARCLVLDGLLPGTIDDGHPGLDIDGGHAGRCRSRSNWARRERAAAFRAAAGMRVDNAGDGACADM